MSCTEASVWHFIRAVWKQVISSIMNTTKWKATLTTCHSTNESDRLDRDEDAEDEENVDGDHT